MTQHLVMPTGLRPRSLAALGLAFETPPAAAWLTALSIFFVYLATCATSLTFYDSPELALVAHELGVGHPVGMPTHTLIGFLFSHIPFVRPHVGLVLMSALFGALCAVPACSLLDTLAGPARSRFDIRLRVGALIAVGVSVVAWEPATRVEVYSLATFLVLYGVARAATAKRLGDAAWVGLALGFAASTHAVIAGTGLLAALFAIALPEEDRPGRVRASMVGTVLGASAVGLLTYATLPLVAADPARFAWGAPSDLAALTDYLRGADYAHNLLITRRAWLDHIGALAGWSFENASLLPAVVGAVAFAAIAKGGLRAAALGTGALAASIVAANVVFHPDVPDYSGWFALPFWLAATGLAALASKLEERGGRWRAYGALVAFIPMVALLFSYTHLTERRDDPSLAEAMARGALEEAPTDAILVVEADHWVAPLLYIQEVESVRPDVVIVAHGLASSSWYWNHLFARHRTLHRIELRGEGGRDGRIARLLDQNPDRPVLAESWTRVAALHRTICGVGWLIFTGDACETASPEPRRATVAIERTRPLRNEALEVAARLGEARGEVLWRAGQPRAALAALVAGLEDESLEDPNARMPVNGPPLNGPLPDWHRPSALHDIARNYVFAGLLLHSVGRSTEALRYIERADRLGLAEARHAREQIQQPR